MVAISKPFQRFRRTGGKPFKRFSHCPSRHTALKRGANEISCEISGLVAPLTRHGFAALFRVPCHFAGVKGQIARDHLRSVDKRRLTRKLGELDQPTAKTMLATLREAFEE